jgi:putative hydrolase of the HAD superfamily
LKLIIIFDLDDTLYLRKDFVFNGLNNVADLIFIRNKHLKKNKIFNELKKLYFNQKNSKIFNDYIKKKKIKNIKIKECINAYRYGKNIIKIYPEAKNILQTYKNKIYLITDGNKKVQIYKIRLLKIKKFFKKIFITNVYGIKYQKPSMFCFKKIKKIENCEYNNMIYIGDNPTKDFINCNKAGMKTIRLLKGEFKNLKVKYPVDAKYKIKSLKELNKFL